jgi:hypothetical protein
MTKYLRVFCCSTLMLLVLGAPTCAQQTFSPEAMAAVRAAQQRQREELRKKLEAMSPAEREQFRAARRTTRNRDDGRPARPIELRAPLPLPVTLQAGGKPAGGSCKAAEACTLEWKTRVGETVVVTSVWAATKVQCDDLTMSTPGSGAPIAVAWRCEHQLIVQGPGAGYAGYVVGK